MAGERRLFTLRADLTSADRTAPTRHHRAGAVRTPVNELVDYRPVMSTVNEGDEIPTVPTGTGWPQPAAGHTISMQAWRASESYSKGGSTVARALFDALVQLETEVQHLKER